jgi:hypothetical protein
MKRKKIIGVILLAELFCMAFALSGCRFTQREIKILKEYYSDDSNYETCTGKLLEIKINDTDAQDIDTSIGSIHLRAEYEFNSEKGWDWYEVIEENQKILKENNFFEEVSIDDEITYKVAPKVFWAGYTIPIVEVVYNGKTYLDFEEGRANLLKGVAACSKGKE